MQLLWLNLFSSLRKPGICISRLYYHFLYVTIGLYIKEACLHNLCMNCASFDRASWTSTTPKGKKKLKSIKFGKSRLTQSVGTIFSHISTTNFAILFSSGNFKRETAIFKSCKLVLWLNFFSSLRKSANHMP